MYLERGSLFSSFSKGAMAEPSRQRDASCKNADGCRDAYRGLCASGQHRTGTRLIGGHNCGISDGWSRNVSSLHDFEGT